MAKPKIPGLRREYFTFLSSNLPTELKRLQLASELNIDVKSLLKLAAALKRGAITVDDLLEMIDAASDPSDPIDDIFADAARWAVPSGCQRVPTLRERELQPIIIEQMKGSRNWRYGIEPETSTKVVVDE